MDKTMMESIAQRSGPTEEKGYGRKVHNKGRYSGLPPGGPCPHCGSPLPWAELLIGTKEIAAFMRVHPKTLNRWINAGRFPATKDGKKQMDHYQTAHRGMAGQWDEAREAAERGQEADTEGSRKGDGERPALNWIDQLEREIRWSWGVEESRVWKAGSERRRKGFS